MHKIFLSTTRFLIGAAISAHLLAIRFGHWVHDRAIDAKIDARNVARLVLRTAEAKLDAAENNLRTTRRQAALYRVGADAESSALGNVKTGQGTLDLRN